MKLKLVNASWNGIDDEGALAFSDCLSNNAVLTELDISCSRIGDKGYAQVMRAFKKNEDLEVLRVGRRFLFLSTVHVTARSSPLWLVFFSRFVRGPNIIQEQVHRDNFYDNPFN